MQARARFELHRRDLGYALLLTRYVPDPRQADAKLIARAAWDTVPNVPLMFWAFRFMAGIGFAMIALFAVAFVLATRRTLDQRWFLWLAVLAIPLPWISAELGWILAEVGRQPWAVDGVLPTFLGASSLTRGQLWATIIGFTGLYGALAVVEIGLILHTIKKGPFAEQDSFEQLSAKSAPPQRLTEEGRNPMAAASRLRDAARHLVGARGRSADRLRPDRRLRHGGRRAVAVRRAQRQGTADGDQHHRRDLGRQPGLVHPRRRRDLRRLAVRLRGQLFRLLPGDVRWCSRRMILRPVGFKYRSKRPNGRWRSFWDWALFVGGFVPALVFGVAMGNVLQGAPFRLDGDAARHLRGDASRPVHALHPAVRAAFGRHAGAARRGLAGRKGRARADRPSGRGRFGTVAALACLRAVRGRRAVVAYGKLGFAITGAADPSGPVQSAPHTRRAVRRRPGCTTIRSIPGCWLRPILGFAGAAVALIGLSEAVRNPSRWRARPRRRSASSRTVGLSMFPFILPSTMDPEVQPDGLERLVQRLMTLFIMLVVTVVFLPIILAYTAWVYR